MEYGLTFSQQSSYSSGGTFVSKFQHNLESESYETFLENLKYALSAEAQGRKFSANNIENAIKLFEGMNFAKCASRNIWVLAHALLIMAKYPKNPLDNVDVKDKTDKVDLIRYIKFLQLE